MKILAIALVLSAMLNVVLYKERNTLKEVENVYMSGYDELMQKKGPGGKKIGELIIPGRVGVFVLENKSTGAKDIVACSMVLPGTILK